MVEYGPGTALSGTCILFGVCMHSVAIYVRVLFVLFVLCNMLNGGSRRMYAGRLCMYGLQQSQTQSRTSVFPDSRHEYVHTTTTVQ